MKMRAIMGVVMTFLFIISTALLSAFTLKGALESENEKRVVEHLESASKIVSTFEGMVSRGELELEEAKSLALTTMRENSYTATEYIWVAERDASGELRFISAPHEPALHGKSFSGVVGKQSEVELEGAIKGTTGTVVTYQWLSTNGEITTLIHSVATKSELFNWYIGNGVQHRHIEAVFYDEVIKSLVVTGAFLIFVLVGFFYSIRRVHSELGGEPEDIVAIAKQYCSMPISEIEIKGDLNQDSVYGCLQTLVCKTKDALSKTQALSSNVATTVGSQLAEVTSLESNMADQLEATTVISQSSTEVGGVTSDFVHISDDILELTAKAKQNSAHSTDLAAETIGSSTELIRDVNSLSVSTDNLLESVSKIGGIVDNISAITEQTNLLALNAAIEAARAGESGRGFAVVADEVRNLAKRTKASTAEVVDVISQLNKNAEVVLGLVGKTTNLATENETRVRQSVDALDKLVESVDVIQAKSCEISDKAKVQLDMFNSIDSSITSLEDQHNASSYSIEEVSKGSKDLAKLLKELDSTLQGM